MCNPYKIKWAVITSLSDEGFNRNYRSALKAAGFAQVGGKGDVFAFHYSVRSDSSKMRLFKAIEKFAAKHAAYKYKQAHLTFTITDKQFGLIGSQQADKLKWRKIPSSLGNIPVTTEQFIYSGNWQNKTLHKA